MIRLHIPNNSVVSLVCLLLALSYRPVSATSFTDLLVNPAWLNARLADPDILILDAREPQAYEAGHIKGAVNLPVNSTYSPTPPNYVLAAEQHIAPLFVSAGIDDHRKVIIYDDGDFSDAARLLWILWVYGHNNSALLSSNLRGWQSLGYPVSLEPAIPAQGSFTPRLNPDFVSSQLYTLLSIDDPGTVIIDVRTPAEYLGEKSTARRYGHIPSAINYNNQKLMILDGEQGASFLDISGLRELFKDLPANRKVITYCNKGKDAALATFALRLLGYKVRLYDGSWAEWGNSDDLPIEGPDQSPRHDVAAQQ